MNLPAWRRRAPLLLFASSLVIYNLNFQRIASGDTVGASLLPFSLLLNRSLALDPFVPWFERNAPQHMRSFVPAHGHFYSAYPIGTPLLATPLYIPAAIAVHAGGWGLDRTVILAGIMEKLSASFLAALSVALFFFLAAEITSPKRALWLSIIYAFATETWTISSQALWQHGAATFTMTCAMLLLTRLSRGQGGPVSLLFAGLCAGWAVVVRPTGLLFLLAAIVWLVWRRSSWRELICFCALPLVLALLLAAYNWYTFHDLLGLYGSISLGSFSAGVLGILVSPSRGLFIYTPVFLFSLAGAAIWLKTRTAGDHPVFFVAVTFSLLQVLVTSKWNLWWGGDCYGPRLLTDIVPGAVLLIIPALDICSRLPVIQRLLVLTVLLSISIQAIGAFCYPNSNWDLTPVPTSIRPERYWDWADNPIFRSIAAGPRIGPGRGSLSRILDTLRN